jgi:flagellar basal body-associated protein FliL
MIIIIVIIIIIIIIIMIILVIIMIVRLWWLTPSVAAFHAGRLAHLQQVPTGGHEGVKSGEQTPRNFAITPCGEFLLVANQTSDSVVVFKVDQETGRLVLPAKHVCDTIASPVCIEFAC